MDIEKIKLIVDLTKAKVDILKIKSDDYKWYGCMDDETRKQLLDTLEEINKQLKSLG